VPVHRTRVAGTAGVPISAFSSAAGAPPRPARVRVARLAPRRVRRRDHGFGEDRGRVRRARELRRDPFAMLPFCGYHMGDYIGHWLSMTERTDASKLPTHLQRQLVPQGRRRSFLWPGFGENSRVLEWICRRSTVRPAVPTPRSVWFPASRTSMLDGLDLPPRISKRPRGRPRRLARRAARHPRVLRRVRRSPPRTAARAARRARGTPRLTRVTIGSSPAVDLAPLPRRAPDERPTVEWRFR
jgi:hypothetical protein